MHFIHYSLSALLLTAGMALSPNASADLLDRGNGLVYDTDLNITWLANANLFKTQAAGNPNLVSQIIAAMPVVNDTANPLDFPVANSGQYSLSAADFNATTGQMTWWGAQAWAATLNFAGYDDWRLATGDAACGVNFNCINAELGHLFYTELGVTAGNAITTSTSPNLALFSNITNQLYWSATESFGGCAAGPCDAWYFNVQGGQQSYNNKNYHPVLAWAVRPGDVSSVPIPAALGLFASALAGLAGLIKRKHQV